MLFVFIEYQSKMFPPKDFKLFGFPIVNYEGYARYLCFYQICFNNNHNSTTMIFE